MIRALSLLSQNPLSLRLIRVRAPAIADLTLYDMVKSLGLGTTIGEIRLLEKTGGKSDFRARGAKSTAGKPRQRRTR